MKRRICFVTSTRAEYGSLKWLMKDIDASEEFQLQIIATGAHLTRKQGRTIDEILEDGLIVDRQVDADIETRTPQLVAESMGRIAERIADAFAELRPHYVAVLGDRYELLPICNSAFVMKIPLIHISGGDVTEGAIDDGIRNAVTMLSSYHFPSNPNSAKNIIRMRGNERNVWTVGALELDALNREKLMTRNELADNLNLDKEKQWILLTYHAETRVSLEKNLEVIHQLMRAVKELVDCQIVATYSNMDYGGEYINQFLFEEGERSPEILKVIPSLGHKRYLSFMKQARFVIGNSSSGITEAPALHVPSINIGDRQKGRHQCSNVIQSEGKYEYIVRAIDKALHMDVFGNDLNYWGEGHAAESIVRILSETIE